MTASTPNRAKPNVFKSRRYIWLIGILSLLLIGILLLSAPASNRINSGSTWGNAPDGYGAWYAYMEAQGAEIKRWQRPLSELIEQAESSSGPATLIRVIPPAIVLDFVSEAQSDDWVDKGNRLIVLRQQEAVTEAPFRSQIDSANGKVTVETRRRNKAEVNSLLADKYGAVVWREKADAIVRSTTPFLAANAYQDAPGNFAFLADLVTQTEGPIWVDEYLHGYKDSDVVVEEVAGSWLGYLAKTPILILAVQAGVILAVALVAQNQRIGGGRSLSSPKVNNSEAYIKALAGVLHKANNHDFLVETLTRAEQKSLQRALGLGDAPVSQATLQTAWQQSTGRDAAQLNVLQAQPRSESTLHTWLQQLQSLHAIVNNQTANKRNTNSQTGVADERSPH